jgi:acetoin utilization deacetylase AcuC-like enzyme
VKVFATDSFELPLPAGHRFPVEKYARVRERVVAVGIVAAEDVVVPHAATDEELTRAHDGDWVRRVSEGRLTPTEVREIGFPWTGAMVERSRRSAGATIEACRAALADGIAVNLAGGTHHAHRDRGAGWCVFNDAAVAARAMQAQRRARRVVVVDLDVHQGNGTASILAGDDSVFTLSVHAARNYPFRKASSDLDVELPDGTGDEAYLDAVRRGLSSALEAGPFELAVYIAGADPHEGDRLGRLRVSKAGLAARDAMVFESCRRHGLSVAVAMGGGYGARVDDTVDVHVETVRRAAQAARSL